MAKNKRDQKQKKKRSLLASLFEPAAESETDGLFDEPDFQDDPELVHLFDDDEVEYSDEQDEAALSELTWSDGARVVEDLPALDRQPKAAGRHVRAKEPAPAPAGRERRARSARRERPQHSGVHRVQRMHPATEESEQQPCAAPPSEDAPVLSEPSGSSPVVAVQQPAQPTAADGLTPPVMDAAAFLRRNAAPSRAQAVQAPDFGQPQPLQDGQPLPQPPAGTVSAAQPEDALSQEQPAGAALPGSTQPGYDSSVLMEQPAGTALPGSAQPGYDSSVLREQPVGAALPEQPTNAFPPALPTDASDLPATAAPSPAASAAGRAADRAPARAADMRTDAPVSSGDESAPILLFDDDPAPVPRTQASRTRMFRTGSGTAARIQMNETETSRSIEEAKRRQREKEAARQHEQYVQRQKRRQRRQRAAKRMAVNIGFVAFLVVAALVALYYTFLLKDIVVSGNDTYSDEYIIGLTGLQYGRHMLFCDLDAAREGIEQDPYLQVDAVDYIFPARVRIQVTERKEVAGIIGLDYNVIIDHNGYVLSMGGGTDLSNLLQVSGVGMTGFQVGQRLGQTDDFGTATLVTMIKELETYQVIDDIASLDLTTPLAIVMYAKNGLKIHVGQPTDLDEKLVSLHALLPQFINANISTGTLYLSARGGTVYSPPNTGAVLPTDPDTVDPDNPITDPNAAPNPDDPTVATPDPGSAGQTTPTPSTPTLLQPGGGDGFQG